jgi:hypothetical protein
LAESAVLVLKACKLPALFDALSEGLDPERPAQLHKGVDGADRFGRVRHRGNERSVNLEGVDRNLAKTRQR